VSEFSLQMETRSLGTLARSRPVASRFPPKIYYVHPAMVGPFDAWNHLFERCRGMAFDHVLTAPLFVPGESGDIFLAGDPDRANPAFDAKMDADELAAALADECRRRELNLMVDVVIDRVDPNGRLATSRPDLFAARAVGGQNVDPRSARTFSRAAYARLDTVEHARVLVGYWRDRLQRLLDAGVKGFRFLNPHALTAALWRELLGELKVHAPGLTALAWTPGLKWTEIDQLSGSGFDGVFSSVAWWDHRAAWFVEEYDILRRVAPVLGCPEAPFDRRLVERLGAEANVAVVYRQRLRVVAAALDGMLVPMGFEHAADVPMDAKRSTPDDLKDAEPRPDIVEEVRAANMLVDRLSTMGQGNELRKLTDPEDQTTALVRLDASDARGARQGLAILINPNPTQPRQLAICLDPLPSAAGLALGQPSPVDGQRDISSALDPAEVRLIGLARTGEIRQRARPSRQALAAAMARPRIAIERIAPAVDNGRFATKRLIGDVVHVEADIFSDGHAAIAADLLWKAADEPEWHRHPMQARDNDRWGAVFRPPRVGRHGFTIEAWSDAYASLCRDITVKSEAGLECDAELEEVRHLVEDAIGRTEGQHKASLAKVLDKCPSSKSVPAVKALLAPETQDAMRSTAQRHFLVRHAPPIAVEVERPQAGIGAWYELFPRSASGEAGRHGTFADVIRALPAVRAMGFDVLYFPPINPIGTTHRKGRNNSLKAAPDDPGSPYAIGNAEAGHDALHPALGTFEDFARLQAAAAAHGLEIALDFAIQCSPDHPWLKQHPEWFRWRSDGSIRFAENPPKKYEDIVNVEFYADGTGLPDLWIALRDIVLFWVRRGIRIFRVDNPHTKPLPFWEWLIGDIRAQHADVIFLAEAFTRPKMMHRLAKIGFSQSYTYFTWRNSKHELIEYLTELSTPPVSDYFRPNLFVNTPDINPHFLQQSGRAGFLIRAALAATLSSLWGIYSGFELCEAAALPGREEYLDSEKYEIKTRDYRALGSIVAEIAKLNRIRKYHPALQQQVGLTFCDAYNDQVVVYGKSLPHHRDAVVVAVSLDPFHPQEAAFELPLWQLGLPDHGTVSVEDLVRDRRFIWTGKMQRIRLDPADMPFAIWRVAPLSKHGP
jgi:starch synthase (maltosyl-transferring)